MTKQGQLLLALLLLNALVFVIAPVIVAGPSGSLVGPGTLAVAWERYREAFREEWPVALGWLAVSVLLSVVLWLVLSSYGLLPRNGPRT